MKLAKDEQDTMTLQVLDDTKQISITYGNFCVIELKGVLPIIMDFDDAKFTDNSCNYIYKDLEDIINKIYFSCNIDFDINKMRTLLQNFHKDKCVLTKENVNIICNTIDTI
jgi:hypothetical protein